jgi:hypothetical protein
VRDRLRVLLLRQRVDRPELLAPAAQPLHAGGERLGLLLIERRGLRGTCIGRQLQQIRHRLGLLCGLLRLVAQTLRGDLGTGHGLARPPQLRLDLGLLARTGA